MIQAVPDPIVAFVTHARRVPAVERERFAERIRDRLGGHALILATCHRVEAYATPGRIPGGTTHPLVLPEGARTLAGEQAIRHVISVAVGADSVVAGEDQILHQMRVSVDAARATGALDPVLDRLFASALQAGRRARSWRQGSQRSLADVALASIERRCGPVLGREVLVVGTGRMGALAVRAARTAGASVVIANRSADGAAALAASAGARVEAFDPDVRIGRFAAVIVALAGPWPIGPTTVDALDGSTTVVVDLSVPAAVPSDAAAILGARLVTADDLALVEGEPEDPLDRPTSRLAVLMDRTTADFLDWYGRRDGRATAEALVQRADHEREAELAALWLRLPNLEPGARDAIAAMARHLTRRLLRPPLERLGRDPDGRVERTVRDIFAL